MEMDSTAKAYWNSLLHDNHSMTALPIPVPDEGWTVWNGDKKIASPTKYNLYSVMTDAPTQAFWTNETHDYTPQ